MLCTILVMAGMSVATTKHASNKSSTGTVKATSSSKSKKTSSKSYTKSSSSKKTSSKSKGKRSASSKKHGQQGISADRAREIQTALIREHYMQGEATGVWDQSTKDALVKFQEDNGWQTKIVPDSRALIKLGLGPSREGLLNPDSAALSGPKELGVEREIPGGAMPHR